MAVEIKIILCLSAFFLFRKAIVRVHCQLSPQKTTYALDEQTTQALLDCFSLARLQFSGSHQIITKYHTSLNGVNGFHMCLHMIGSDIEL